MILKVCDNEAGCRKRKNDILEEDEKEYFSSDKEEVPLKPIIH